MRDSSELGVRAAALAKQWQQSAAALALALVEREGLDERRLALVDASSEVNAFVRHLGLPREFLPRDTFNRLFNVRARGHPPVVLLKLLEDQVMPGAMASSLRHVGAVEAAQVVEAAFELSDAPHADQPEIFVCYSSGDALWSRAVALQLARTHPVWLDQLATQADPGWRSDDDVRLAEATIDRLLATVDTLVVVYSFEWMSKAGFAHRELVTALGRPDLHIVVVATDLAPRLAALQGAPSLEVEDLLAGSPLPAARVSVRRAAYDPAASLALARGVRLAPDPRALLSALRVLPRARSALKSARAAHDHEETAVAIRFLDPILSDPRMAPRHPLMRLGIHRAVALSVHSLAILCLCHQAHQPEGGGWQRNLATMWSVLGRLVQLDPLDGSGPADARPTPAEQLAANQHALDTVDFLLTTWQARWSFDMIASLAAGEDLDVDDETFHERWVDRLQTYAKRLGDTIFALHLLTST